MCTFSDSLPLFSSLPLSKCIFVCAMFAISCSPAAAGGDEYGENADDKNEVLDALGVGTSNGAVG